METQIIKLQEQIKRVMGIDKMYYMNGLEITSKAANGSVIFKNVAESEFVEMMKTGSDKINERLLSENNQLKDCL